MIVRSEGMKIPWKNAAAISCFTLILLCYNIQISKAQDYGGDESSVPAAPPPEQENCDGIFVSYTFDSREREYPFVKNVSAQAWAFNSMLTVINTGLYELKSWKVHVGFQHNELLVSTDGAVAVEGDGFPIKVGKNGTVLAGFPQSDLKTAIDTAGDFTQMAAQVKIKGTQFGVSPKATPMPRTIKLLNDGYKCPAPKRFKTYMHACCKRDPKFKPKNTTLKFMPRRYGDLSFTYDVLSAYENKYQAQVTIDNLSPLGRLDHWNLTWEWMRNEFIYSMKGAYTHKKDPSECIYGPQGQYYKDFDFTTVLNCQKKPLISDLPPEKENDDKLGKIPYCCRNGTLLPPTMNETKARSIFQLEVFKLPPDMNRTALYPPQNWKIEGTVNPSYKCGPPVRVDPTGFPDPSGTGMTSTAVASWQITCNITRPKPKENKCCVSFSAYYADSVIPCNTCACGCQQTSKCDANRKPLLLPPQALLVPFEDREEMAEAWNAIKHFGPFPKKLPCPDNCGVSINWHVDSDYKSGWTARVTLFNWGNDAFEDWFTAIQMKKNIAEGYENVYSFNGTKLPQRNDTIFMQGLPGLNYLVGEVNGTNPGKDPRVPGKQQSVISFLKNHTPNINIPSGDGFPAKIFFNGEECALPTDFPKRNAAFKSQVGLLPAVLLALLTLLLTDQLH
ncbi:COBRA-like protein 10 [Nicotiana tabacum]|uniref:COBRA-like protein 10 n=5 Tax=Nicotiana TaxID=4085 RepID=A0AC58UUB3_TOBAC|nr:PREDICTED: COBRA-like protein 10 [Nicotiana sylvestris]XP_009792857.1 PREDICTED: COBRA-like protein 10 [Nicotiana sylvestris]XP_009792858.1 PREDICTED: COBRA-like protein 10 [Nicotiana sylvestris]